MNWTTIKTTLLEFLAAAAIFVIAWFVGNVHGKNTAFDDAETKTDTVVKVVTVYKDFPQPQQTAQIGYIAVPAYKFITDTVNVVETAYLHDTTVLYLPREQKYYEEEEGRLRLWVSGYEPSLDRYEMDAVTTTVTNTVYVKPPRWSFTISAGWGLTYDVIKKSVGTGPTIAGGISYRF